MADFDEMGAGAELDMLVAVRVMGRKARVADNRCWVYADDNRPGWYPSAPSTEIRAAWEVVAEYQKRPGCFMGLYPRGLNMESSVEIVLPISLRRLPDRKREGFLRREGGMLSVYAETIPLAICRAALLATEDSR